MKELNIIISFLLCFNLSIMAQNESENRPLTQPPKIFFRKTIQLVSYEVNIPISSIINDLYIRILS